MRNKISLSPKTKTTVSVQKTLVYASVGAGIFVMIFTGAFFYLNMGNSEKAIADVPVSTVEAKADGEWSTASIWLDADGLSRKPENGDTITIPQGVTVTIDNDVNLSHVTLLVFGNIKFTKAKLILDAFSEIIFYEGSNVDAEGAEGHNHIRIGTNHYHTGSINALESPIYLDKDSGQAGSPIPEDKLPPTLLPIVLDYFKAEITASSSILVEWGTVSEKENDFFTLERSSDGKTFETIATIEGAGNSLQKLQYSFEDKKSTVGMNYYRLKQTDYNGDFEYFKIVGVNNTVGSLQGATLSQDAAALSISDAYPNPFKSEVNLTFEAEMDGNVEIMVQNSRGTIIHKEVIPFHYGTNEYKFTKGDQLQPGIYYINLWSNGKKFKPQRLIKM